VQSAQRQTVCHRKERSDAAIPVDLDIGRWFMLHCNRTRRTPRRIMSLVGDATLEVNMQPEAGDDAVEFLVARAGLSPTQEQMAGLKVAYRAVAAMAVSVRKPRGRMAEPVLTYSFGEEDLT
jgi:hypothetical protein